MPSKSIKIIVKGFALPLAFVVGVACGDLEEALENEECFSDADCGNKLDCVISNPNNLNVGLLGWCVENPACVPGEQPYCTCVIDLSTEEPTCVSTGESDRMVPYTKRCWDGIDPNTCLCVPQGATCQYGDL